MLKPRRARRRDERGFSLVLMALLLLSMLGVAGLVVDLGGWQVEATRIQQAADAAALGAVVRLPDGEPAAKARALEIAADNGYVDDSAEPDPTRLIDVVATEAGEETFRVTIVNRNVAQYFTGLFRDAPTITRTSTAQYVQPVPLGSPRNYLGTNQLMTAHGVTGNGIENFYLAVSGHCSRREYGDRITPYVTNNGNSPHSCLENDQGSHENPEKDKRGYLFGVSVPDANGGVPVAIQMFDAPVCTGRPAPPTSPIFGEQAAAFDVRVTVRKYDLDPYGGDELSPPVDLTFQGSASNLGGHCLLAPPGPDGECDAGQPLALRDCWTTLATVTAPGDYVVQVDPVDPPTAAPSPDQRHDVFSLRAKRGATFQPCTGDDTETASSSPPYQVTCPQVHGLQHLPIYARGNNSPTFFLASIDERHNNKTLQVTLYDSAEGATGISLVSPSGTIVPVEWEILCSDGQPEDGGCSPSENDPLGGRDGPPVTEVPVGGTVGPEFRTFPNNIQNGKYSDRLLRLTYELPGDIHGAYGGRTWWKIQYRGAFAGDRTTWTVQLLGDPVRLIPNA